MFGLQQSWQCCCIVWSTFSFGIITKVNYLNFFKKNKQAFVNYKGNIFKIIIQLFSNAPKFSAILLYTLHPKQVHVFAGLTYGDNMFCVIDRAWRMVSWMSNVTRGVLIVLCWVVLARWTTWSRFTSVESIYVVWCIGRSKTKKKQKTFLIQFIYITIFKQIRVIRVDDAKVHDERVLQQPWDPLPRATTSTRPTRIQTVLMRRRVVVKRRRRRRLGLLVYLNALFLERMWFVVCQP